MNKIKNKREVVLDTETTGLSVEEGHRIIEIGCVEIIDGRITENKFHTYINPQKSIDYGARRIHGLTEDFLSDKPLFSEIAYEFLSFIKDATVIIHNAPFDISFINSEIQRLKRNIKPINKICRIIDTLNIARAKYPGKKNTLDALCKRYGINASGRGLHGALIDSELLAKVYLTITKTEKNLFNKKQQEEIDNKKIISRKHLAFDYKEKTRIVYASKQENDRHIEFLEKIKFKMNGHQ